MAISASYEINTWAASIDPPADNWQKSYRPGKLGLSVESPTLKLFGCG